MAKEFIYKLYINEKTCGSPQNSGIGKIAHILDTGKTHATDYDKEIFSLQNLDTDNKSICV